MRMIKKKNIFILDNSYSMKENTIKIKSMVTESFIGLQEILIKENIEKMKEKVMVKCGGRMVVVMSVNG